MQGLLQKTEQVADFIEEVAIEEPVMVRLSWVAGFGIPVMAAINSQLGGSLNNPILATAFYDISE